MRDDVTAGIFKERVQTRAALVVEKPTGVIYVWKNFKECVIKEAVEVCWEIRGMRRHKESWWWNEGIAALVKEKQCLFKLLKGPKKCRKGCRCRRGKEARSMDPVAYLGFQKGGAKFLLATSAHTKGGNQVFQFFPIVKKIFFCQRGPWPNAPTKYATAWTI